MAALTLAAVASIAAAGSASAALPSAAAESASPPLAFQDAAGLQLELDRTRRNLWLMGAGLLLTLAGAFRWKRAVSPRIEGARLVLLSLLAASAFASYYDFFRVRHYGDFRVTDVYHYYMGSKYAAQLGYFDLYDCTLAVLVDEEVVSRFALPTVRDQHTLKIRTPEEALTASQRCRAAFEPEQWPAFREDVLFFDARWPPDRWEVVFRDHGYNPTPVWSGVIGPLARTVDLGSSSFALLVRADAALVLVCAGFIAWAFGVEAAALALLVWGTGHHWSYTWIGDSLLRNLWLSALLIGLSLLAQGRALAAGALLGLSSLLRIFPSISLVAVALHGLVHARRGGRPSRSMLRLLAGAALAAAVLVAWSVVAGGRGPAIYGEYAEKLSAFAARPGLNKLGLPTLAWQSVLSVSGNLATNESGRLILTPVSSPALEWIIGALRIGLLLPALYLFWRALPRIREWQAAALGVALIPLLSSPANYYYGFVLAFVMLGAERARIRVAVALAALAWLANGLVFHRVPAEYIGAGTIAVLLSYVTLFEMSRAPGEPEDQRGLRRA